MSIEHYYRNGHHYELAIYPLTKQIIVFKDNKQVAEKDMKKEWAEHQDKFISSMRAAGTKLINELEDKKDED